MMRIKWLFPVLTVLLVLFAYAGKRSEGTIDASDESTGEIVVTLTEQDRSLLDEGDALRKERKFEEAIASYRNVISSDIADKEIKKEAQYNIGLCRIEQGAYDDAVALYKNMMNKYHNDGNAVAHVQYCLAWIEVQQGAYDSAIQRLDKTLVENKCTDKELCARTQFMIGRIYLSFLFDYDSARNAFEEVLAKYPGTKICEHPYLKRNR